MNTEREKVSADGLDALSYHKMRKARSRQCARRAEYLLSLLVKSDPIKILDLGGGSGILASELARRARPGSVVAVSDIDGELIRLNENPSISLVINGRDSLPFKDDEFDLVVCDASVHHMVYPNMMMMEAWRITAPGGMCIFWDLTPDSFAAKIFTLMTCLPEKLGLLPRPFLALRSSIKKGFSLVEMKDAFNKIAPGAFIFSVRGFCWWAMARKELRI